MVCFFYLMARITTRHQQVFYIQRTLSTNSVNLATSRICITSPSRIMIFSVSRSLSSRVTASRCVPIRQANSTCVGTAEIIALLLDMVACVLARCSNLARIRLGTFNVSDSKTRSVNRRICPVNLCKIAAAICRLLKISSWKADEEIDASKVLVLATTLADRD